MPAALLLSVITNSNKASYHIQYLRKKNRKKIKIKLRGNRCLLFSAWIH